MFEGVGRRLGTKKGFLLDIGIHSLNGRERNVLFRNNGNETFTEVGWVNAAARIEDGRGLAVFDYNGDGALDLVMRNYRTPSVLLRNSGVLRHWIGFELVGTRSNRDAVGARVRLRTGDHWQTRVVNTGSGYLSGSSRRLHFGLGDATQVDQIEIDWPSGERTELRDLAADRRYEIIEGATLSQNSR
ncbi:MAG: CRTAC1 family protein [Myxococcota bacterium]